MPTIAPMELSSSRELARCLATPGEADRDFACEPVILSLASTLARYVPLMPSGYVEWHGPHLAVPAPCFPMPNLTASDTYIPG